MIVDVTDTTVTLSWSPPSMPNGIITQYRVRFSRSDNSDSRTRDTMNYILMYTVTGLASNTEYTFEVRAFTRVGGGDFSDDTVTVRTSKLSVSMVVTTRGENNGRPFAGQISNVAAHFLVCLTNFIMYV